MNELILEPTAMAAGGAALARESSGRVVFVEGALPGETVRARLTQDRRDYARAIVVDILAVSPDRVSPPCPAVDAGCGGCTWQHVLEDAQARLKAGIVVDALRRIARLADPPQPRMVALNGAALRTTARLAVSDRGQAGHRPRRGSGVVETHSCRAVHPLLEELIVEGRYPGAREVLLRVGVASGERVVRVDREAASVRVPDDVVVSEEGDGHDTTVHEVVAGRRFRVSADSFFQSGPVAAEGLVTAVSAAAGAALGVGARLVDAYAGVGLFGSVLGAIHRAEVIAVESQPQAAADTRANLGDIDALVVTAEIASWRLHPDSSRPDLVVADPARSGLGRPGVASVVATDTPRLVLVSCDPASFARDVLLLGAAGYRLDSVALVDAFPDTFHVETVSRFDRIQQSAAR